MSRRLSFASLLLVATAVSANAQTFRATLSGDREVPGPGDGAGRGFAAATLDGSTLHYYLLVQGIAVPTAAHIHTGQAGQSGAVVVDFAPTFSALAGGAFAAAGAVTLDVATAQSIAANPMAYYFNVHNGSFQGGALRGQLAGDGASTRTFAAALLGSREVPAAGDPDGLGFAAATFDGTNVYYYVWVKNIAAPTAAHIHRGSAGQSGTVAVDFAPTFAGGSFAFGAVAAPEATSGEISSNPSGFYFNVHNGSFSGGALRGQLGSPETVLHFPVVSKVSGQAGSQFRTDVRIANPSDQQALVFAEFYAANTSGLAAPSVVVPLAITPGAQGVYDEFVGTVFSTSGNGAVRLIATEPIGAVARIFNDQRNNPAIGGTFGQFSPGLDSGRALTQGALLLLANRPAADAAGYRTNLGYFNASGKPVSVTFAARNNDGSLLGSNTLTLQPRANRIDAVFNIVSSVPSTQRTIASFFVTYSASDPIFVFASSVDNKTNDGINIIPVPFTVPAAPSQNNPPNGTILTPTTDQTIRAGQSVSFSGSATDPEGDAVTVLWNFGDSQSSTALAPGSHTYAAPGVFTVTFTATDSHGLADPTPDVRAITVNANAAPNGAITLPAGPVTISAGQSVSFAGTATDPDGDSTTVVWDFGDGVTSTAAGPSHTYVTPGTYTVTFTVIDSFGLADPTPDTRGVTVNAAVTLTQVQAQIFTPFCSGCHPPNGGLNLGAGSAWSSTVNVNSSEQSSLKRIKPGDPDNSYLYRKVNGGPSITGSRMPQGGPFLSAAQIQLLRDWILAGAPNN